MHLKRRRLITPLFDRGRADVLTVTQGPVRVVFRMAPRKEIGYDVPFQIGFTVSKRIRRAVDRNRIKRLLREAFRSTRGTIDKISIPDSLTLTAMVLYRGNDTVNPETLRRSLVGALATMTAKAGALLNNHGSAPGGQ